MHRRGVTTPNGSREPIKLLSLVPEALFSNVNRLGLFAIVRGHCFEASESWLAFYWSRTIDWTK